MRTESGLFFGKTIMEYKELPAPMTVDQQIDNLKALHLIIKDEADVREKLSKISYYRLIKAYGTSYKNKGSGIFKKNVSFDDIYHLYEFDNQLRYILFPVFEKIEISLRCRIANYFGVKYGSMGYLDEKNFEKNYTDLLDKINTSIEYSQTASSIKHFTEEYGKVPLYAAIEVFSFGVLSDFYKSMHKEDRTAIAKLYYKGDERYLSSWFDSIAYTRNICAHFGRLYQKNITKLPLLFSPEDDDVKNNNRLFRVLCCMRYVCHEFKDWGSVVASIKDLIDSYEGLVKTSGLGFSDGWFDKLLDQEPLTVRLIYNSKISQGNFKFSASNPQD